MCGGVSVSVARRKKEEEEKKTNACHSSDPNLSPWRSAHASSASCLEGDGDGASSAEELVVAVVVDGVETEREDPIEN